MVPDIIQSFRESMRRRRAFLEDARDDIRSDNLNMACFSSAIALGLLVLFLLITPLRGQRLEPFAVPSRFSPYPFGVRPLRTALSAFLPHEATGHGFRRPFRMRSVRVPHPH